MTKKAFDYVNRLSSKELSRMSREMFMTYLKIVNFSYIKESVGDDDDIMSYEEFTSFITSLGKNNEKVLEQFNNFLKRMNDVK
jgi:phage-related protein